MGVFFNDWSGPGQQVVDPRKTIRLSWYFYQGTDPSTDDVLQYFRVSWKHASIKGWTDSSIKSMVVPKEQRYVDLPPHSFTLDSAWVWRVEAWVIDKDYQENVPPGEGVPTNIPFIGSETQLVVDTSGYIMDDERNKTAASGANAFVTVKRPAVNYAAIVLDPGEYEVRFRVSNGFQWSAYSTPVKLVLYDTKKFVKKGSEWWAVPEWKKTSGTMTRIKRN
jgi:hypothetical protein